MSDQPFAKASTDTGNTETQRKTSMPRAGFKPTIPVTKQPSLTPQTTQPLGQAFNFLGFDISVITDQHGQPNFHVHYFHYKSSLNKKSSLSCSLYDTVIPLAIVSEGTMKIID
jgi:hypothetical protein